MLLDVVLGKPERVMKYGVEHTKCSFQARFINSTVGLLRFVHWNLEHGWCWFNGSPEAFSECRELVIEDVFDVPELAKLDASGFLLGTRSSGLMSRMVFRGLRFGFRLTENPPYSTL